MMKLLDDIPFELDREEVFARLHLKSQSQIAGEVDALIDRAREIARPRALYKVAFVENREDGAVVVAEAPRHLLKATARHSGAETARARFASRVLRLHLDKVDRVFPYVVTCGTELDSIPVAEGDAFAQFCRDTIKEMALWAGIGHLYVHLQNAHGVGALASMNPGSGEANVWPIEQQRELFAFLGDVRAATGVVLTASCLMVPNKTVSGLFYPSEDGFESCQLCRQERCPERRAPFDPEMWTEVFGEG